MDNKTGQTIKTRKGIYTLQEPRDGSQFIPAVNQIGEHFYVFNPDGVWRQIIIYPLGAKKAIKPKNFEFVNLLF